jgi:hypothetical protein
MGFNGFNGFMGFNGFNGFMGFNGFNGLKVLGIITSGFQATTLPLVSRQVSTLIFPSQFIFCDDQTFPFAMNATHFILVSKILLFSTSTQPTRLQLEENKGFNFFQSFYL